MSKICMADPGRAANTVLRARLQKLQKLQKHKFLNKAEKPCAAGVFSPKTTKTTKTTKNKYIDKS